MVVKDDAELELSLNFRVEGFDYVIFEGFDYALILQ